MSTDDIIAFNRGVNAFLAVIEEDNNKMTVIKTEQYEPPLSPTIPNSEMAVTPVPQ